MNKGHLITCLDMGEVKKFDENGFVGAGPFFPSPGATDRQIGARLRIMWDVIADLKRARPRDVCFLHSEGRIFGPYIFASTFRESVSLPNILQSSNATYDSWIKNKAVFGSIRMHEYGYIASILKPQGCNSNGTDLMDLFLNK